jgi:hypothetical protein
MEKLESFIKELIEWSLLYFSSHYYVKKSSDANGNEYFFLGLKNNSDRKKDKIKKGNNR